MQAPSRAQSQGRSGSASRPARSSCCRPWPTRATSRQAEAKAATIDPDQTIRTKVAGSESYVADWVEQLVQSYVGDVKEDIVVYTTINWDLQKEAEFLVKEAVAEQGPKYHFSQGALVAVDTDGAVRAVVGGADYSQSQYNRAVTARRQPGSTFKPFVYMAAMEKGYTPDTIADDDPININGWSPADADNKFMGPITLRDGARLFAQHRRGAARLECRSRQGRRGRAAHGHLLAADGRCPRSRSARRKSRCSS